MTTFLGDPRQRDDEEHALDTTALGPNFPGSLNDLWRMVFRPSRAFLRYVTLAVTNDDGSALMASTEDKLQKILEELQHQNDLLGALLADTQELTGQSQ